MNELLSHRKCMASRISLVKTSKGLILPEMCFTVSSVDPFTDGIFTKLNVVSGIRRHVVRLIYSSIFVVEK